MNEEKRKLIDKICQLAQKDSEFDAELRKRLGGLHKTFSDAYKKRVKYIESYLCLDFYVDHMNSVADYSFINEIEIRNQLESDNREMMRYRYGSRQHVIKFDEFCRYAQFQGEMLINYFYTKIERGDIDKIKSHIVHYNPQIDSKIKGATSIEAIPFMYKMWSFTNEFGLSAFSEFKYAWTNIPFVRNNASHRTPTASTNSSFFQRKFAKEEPFSLVITSLSVLSETIKFAIKNDD